MWESPYFLEEHIRERTRSPSRQVALRWLAEEYQEGSPCRWRRVLARRLASLSLRLDRRGAQETLEARPLPR